MGCAEENHLDGLSTHYHLALKLDRVKRWKAVRKSLEVKYGICVNFSDHHSNYFTAFKYVTKEYPEYITSPNHPTYLSSPITKYASMSRKRNSLASNKEDLQGGC